MVRLHRYAYDIQLVTLMEPTPFYSQSPILSACRILNLLALFYFLRKVPFLAFLCIRKGVWPLGYAYDVTLVKHILDKYWFVGSVQCSFLAKIELWEFLVSDKGVAIYTCS